MEENTVEKIVEISHLTKKFQGKDGEITVLSDINMDVEKGHIVSVIGGSGCGKSTMLRMIGGLDTTYEGSLLVDHKKVQAPSREIGFIFQDHRLLPWLNVKENIRFSLKKEQKQDEDYIQKYIDLVGLHGFEKALHRELQLPEHWQTSRNYFCWTNLLELWMRSPELICRISSLISGRKNQSPCSLLHMILMRLFIWEIKW